MTSRKEASDDHAPKRPTPSLARAAIIASGLVADFGQGNTRIEVRGVATDRAATPAATDRRTAAVFQFLRAQDPHTARCQQT